MPLQFARASNTRKRLVEASWDKPTEEMIAAWGEKAAGMRWMHLKASKQWSRWANMTGMIALAITSAASVVGFAGDVSWALTAVGIMNVFAATAQATQQFYRAMKEPPTISAALGASGPSHDI